MTATLKKNLHNIFLPLFSDGSNGQSDLIELWAMRFAFAVLLSMSAIIIYTVAHHAMWLDELQAWALVKESRSIPDFFAHLKFEGHPALWFIAIKIIQCFTDNPVALQGFHTILALASLFLIWRFAPFTGFEKILLLMCFPFAFQFAVIARSYGLGIFLLIVGLVLRRQLHKKWAWIAWGLAANTSILVAAIAGGLGLLTIMLQPKEVWRERAFIACAILFGLVALYSVIPSPDFAVGLPLLPKDWPINQSFLMFLVKLARSWGWSEEFSASRIWQNVEITPGGAIMAVFCTQLLILVLSIHYAAVLSFAAIIAVFLYIHFFRYIMGHYHFLLLQVAVVFLVWHVRPKTNVVSKVAFLAFLIPSVIVGWKAFSYSYFIPFSQSLNTANWIKDNHLENELWIGALDLEMAPVFSYLQRPVYYPQCQCYGPYISWQNTRKPLMTINEVLDQTDAVMRERGVTKAYLILSRWFNWENTMEDKDLKFVQIQTFMESEVSGEQYGIYMVERIQKPKKSKRTFRSSKPKARRRK